MNNYQSYKDYLNEEEQEQEIEDWLRNNDPLFHNYKGRKELEHPYLSSRQLKRKNRRHIPFSPDLLDVVK